VVSRTITFDSVALDRPYVQSPHYTISSSDVTLIDGKHDIYTETNYGTEYTIMCTADRTAGRTNLELLKGKSGVAGSLVFDTVDMGTYRITDIREDPAKDYLTYFRYYVTLKRHTAG
jgi:hypothetical protein